MTEESSFCFSKHCNCGRRGLLVLRHIGFGTVLIGDMLCRKQRLEAEGVGCSAAKAVKAVKVEDKDDDDEDEWKEDDDEDTDGGSRLAYRKNKWKLVAVWTNIDKQEAFRRAAEIMIDDFQVAGGPVHAYADPTERKIGPYGHRNLSISLVCLIQPFDKEL